VHRNNDGSFELSQPLLIEQILTALGFKCRVFEDNTGAKTIAAVPKFRPRTKHINIKYWHFIEHVEKGMIDIQSVKSKDQPADIFTKPLPESEFIRLRDIILSIQPNHSPSTFQGSVKEKASPKTGNIDSKIGCAQRGERAALHNAIGVKSGEANVISSDEVRSS